MPRADLRSDCARCEGVCCSALAFDAGPAFAFAKAAGERCRHLTAAARCAIHAQLAERGFAGCAAFDCFGAGPRASAEFPGAARERERGRAFHLWLPLHEAIWQLEQAQALAAREGLRPASLARERARLEALAALDVALLRAADVDAARTRVDALLRELGAALGERRREPGLSKSR